MSRLLQDLRYAMRQLRKSPGFTLDYCHVLARTIYMSSGLCTQKPGKGRCAVTNCAAARFFVQDAFGRILAFVGLRAGAGWRRCVEWMELSSESP